MPLLQVQSAKSASDAQKREFLSAASSKVARLLGKPETYMMVTVEDDAQIIFAGSHEPAAYFELKSIGDFDAGDEAPAVLSAAICELISEHLGVPTNRVYGTIAGWQRHLWAFDKKTFG